MSDDFDREAVIRRVRALMEKTVANGCSEAEAMLAAQKLGEIMNKYQLSLTDIKLKEEIVEQLDVQTSSYDGGPMFNVISGIAYFTDTKVWRSRRRNKTALFKFLGFKTDVIVAKYIYDICMYAQIYGWEDHRKSVPNYTHLPSSHKTRLKNGFFMGFASSVDAKLRKMKDAQRAENVATTGRDLVIIKKPVIDAEFDKLGIALKTAVSRQVSMDSGAWYAGYRSGEAVQFNPGVHQSTKKSIS
jgi:hypothetical protein